jgi:hypothetical protein
MDILTVSQKTLSELTEVDTVSTEDFSKVCKYFLQVIMRGRTTLEIGVVSTYNPTAISFYNVPSEENLEPALSAASTVLLEAARVRASTDQIR